MKKIAVLFSGAGTTFEYLISSLPSDIKIALAICNNPSAKGIEIALKHNIPLQVIDSKAYKSREDFDSKVVEELQKEQVDLVVLAGFMRILTPVFTKKIRAINLHPSLLPRHKGMHAIEKSFHDEYANGGVSIHFVDDELDSGDIILQKEISKDSLSFEVYYEKIKKMEKVALKEAIEKILERG